MKIPTLEQRVSKGASERAAQRVLTYRLTPEQQLAALNGQMPVGLPDLLEDELSRQVVPNRQMRREHARAGRLNVKQAAKREAYVHRAIARRRKAIAAAYAELADRQPAAA